MKIYKEQSLRDFDFGPQADENKSILSEEQLDQIEMQLEELYPDGIDEYNLEDLFRFDFEWVLSLIGAKTEDKIDQWWKLLSDEEKWDVSSLRWEDFLPEGVEPVYEDTEEELQAQDMCTEESDDWWDGLRYDEKSNFYNQENN